MRVERKRRGKTLPARWHGGKLESIQFDGYYTVVHFVDEEAADVRVIFERAEAEALAEQVAENHRAQRERVKTLCQAYDELSEAPEGKR